MLVDGVKPGETYSVVGALLVLPVEYTYIDCR